MSDVSTQIQLVNRPHGWPTQDDFRTVDVELDQLAPGQVRVANEFISVDPYMRGRMIDTRSYIPPFALGATMTGGAVGRVVTSTVDALPVGSLVLHQFGWRDIAQGEASDFRLLPEPPEGMASSVYLGMLGMTGLTAYVGLLTVAAMQPGDTVFVSGAAGAVGTAVGQIARRKGASRVIGSAGSAEKVALLTERYGFDAAFNYKDGPVRTQLRDAAPDGIDVYFDNVGGDHLEAALDSFNDGGRATLCGAIAQYNNTSRTPGPTNMTNIVTRGLTLTGFTVGNYLDQTAEFNREMGGWLTDGSVVHDETVVDGVENAVDAFLGLMRGVNRGKMVVRTQR
ncbi:Alcohol dehydrogenase zinc-binding domain protein [Gordonia bronchialis DSM 43247]|uniref:Alcohol dehydrogenase zinc-binding domain protein n=1 Tax=Gordonia bronchialis (strain ATCC 25592 / DSM 43247 / BCRC 13721 / JCM 3198 / KCTC 3076 / NBRC 16047 / NCTC 10667) TaxID=526226 RepID=D0LBL3_GORB4|nr:NADP-dependent oxidoreductase [Gordonia bronchialis]ACY21427.1 Alcohol dehydrogenase zinc-binding domain protein [Gordonia bronchialis DSM 43247]MCC3324210.1 NADP-dependent oxidoreductase [Gordonia bronchialis]QGS24910.1 zinc-binding dehydrogenase [Gordonia bronchialis]STQ64308.1 NADPH-dependent curcumin reductase [Gordonia bronchialis]